MKKGMQGARTGGFSLLELMIAMVVICFTLFGVMSMISYTIKVRQAARENQVAAEWVLRRIEEVKAQKASLLNTLGYYQANTPVSSPIQYQGVFSYAWTPAPHGINPAGIPVSPTAPSSQVLGTPPELSNAQGLLVIDYSNQTLYEVTCTLTWTSSSSSGHQTTGTTPAAFLGSGVANKGVYSMRSLIAP